MQVSLAVPTAWQCWKAGFVASLIAGCPQACLPEMSWGFQQQINQYRPELWAAKLDRHPLSLLHLYCRMLPLPLSVVLACLSVLHVCQSLQQA